MQDVAEVSYVPLETTEDVLLDGGVTIEVLSSKGIVCVSDNKVYIYIILMENCVPFLIKRARDQVSIIISVIRMSIGNVRKFMCTMNLIRRCLFIPWMEDSIINMMWMSEFGKKIC